MNTFVSVGSLLIAQVAAIGPQQSYFESFVSAAGRGTCAMILAVGLALFVGACYVVAKCPRPAVIAAYLVLLPLPLVASLFGLLWGIVNSLLVLSASGAAQPTTAEFAAAAATSVSPLLLWLAVTVPSYLVLGMGLVLRTLTARKIAC